MLEEYPQFLSRRIYLSKVDRKYSKLTEGDSGDAGCADLVQKVGQNHQGGGYVLSNFEGYLEGFLKVGFSVDLGNR
jgi:hypothetical protein